MMWYPGKAAFRAGTVSSNQWDDAYVGTYSAAMGADTVASGSYSFASGLGTVASGLGSVAFGTNATASGQGALAIGNGTSGTGNYAAVASAQGATAIGYGAVASGPSSTSIGNFTTATGTFATAFGNFTEAQAHASFVLGQYNLVAGDPLNWVTADPLFVIGNGTGASARANAFTVFKNGNTEIAGRLTVKEGVLFKGGAGSIPATGAGTRMMWHPSKAALRAGAVTANQWDDGNIGSQSLAVGYNTTASGSVSAAFGEDCSSSGTYAFTGGKNCSASGSWTVSLGKDNAASGNASVAMGLGCTASGPTSVAMGSGAVATGNNAVAIGYKVEAQSESSLAVGHLNVIAGTTNSIVMTDPVFVVGNGTDGVTPVRSNALTLLRNGNMTIAGTLTENSDERLKRDIEPLGPVLAKVAAIRGVRYLMKDVSRGPAGPQIGLLAQEVRAQFPELVREDSEGTLSVSYGKFAAVLLEAVKEQQAEIQAGAEACAAGDREIESLRREIEELRAVTREMKARLAATSPK
jgi:autotransporter adhesin